MKSFNTIGYLPAPTELVLQLHGFNALFLTFKIAVFRELSYHVVAFVAIIAHLIASQEFYKGRMIKTLNHVYLV